MKILKYIAQCIAAVLYSNVIGIALFFLMLIPINGLLHIELWKALLVIFFAGMLILNTIDFIKFFLLLPYAWIIKNNKTALAISIILTILQLIQVIFRMWGLDHTEFWHTILLIAGTCEAVFCYIGICLALLQFKAEERRT